MTNTEDTSFYLEELPSDIRTGSGPLLRDDRFREITPLHDSASCRIMTALRYGKRYVLKTLAASKTADSLYRSMLRKEFEIGVSLDHPNIRQTFGIEEVERMGECIVLEYVDGLPLDEAMERKLITLTNVRSIARQLSSALHYLHSKQVIHRDLRPANILVTMTGGVVKLIDFSLADSESFAVVKSSGGNRSYMAPEQASAAYRPSVEADIYALGKIIREVAAATGDKELYKKVACCMNQDPAGRPHSIAETGLLDMPLTPYQPVFDLNSGKLTVLLLILTAVLIMIILLASVSQ